MSWKFLSISYDELLTLNSLQAPGHFLPLCITSAVKSSYSNLGYKWHLFARLFLWRRLRCGWQIEMGKLKTEEIHKWALLVFSSAGLNRRHAEVGSKKVQFLCDCTRIFRHLYFTWVYIFLTTSTLSSLFLHINCTLLTFSKWARYFSVNASEVNYRLCLFCITARRLPNIARMISAYQVISWQRQQDGTT